MSNIKLHPFAIILVTIIIFLLLLQFFNKPPIDNQTIPMHDQPIFISKLLTVKQPINETLIDEVESLRNDLQMKIETIQRYHVGDSDMDIMKSPKPEFITSIDHIKSKLTILQKKAQRRQNDKDSFYTVEMSQFVTKLLELEDSYKKNAADRCITLGDMIIISQKFATISRDYHDVFDIENLLETISKFIETAIDSC